MRLTASRVRSVIAKAMRLRRSLPGLALQGEPELEQEELLEDQAPVRRGCGRR